jgi:hypothetical protein
MAASSSTNAVQLFIRSHNETLSVVAMRVSNPKRFRFLNAEWFGTIPPCSLSIAFPSEGQEIDCKLQSNYS